MATEKEIEFVMKHLEKVNPTEFFQALNESSVGARAVLRYLYERGGDATAGNISEFMNVSTARIAVLIKKMVLHGLVTKESMATDARITIVRITPYGEERIKEMRDEIYAHVGHVIDKVGMEKLHEFIEISEEIRAALTPPKIDGF